EKPRLPNSETGAGTRGAGAGCSLGGLASEPLAKLAVVVSVVVAGARVLGTNFVFATGTPISVGTRPTTTRTNRVVDASKPAAGAQRHATRSAKSLLRFSSCHPRPSIPEERGVVTRPKMHLRLPAGWRRRGAPSSRGAS